MFKQFAVTLVIAVVLSGIVALTLTPALCALLLKESNEAHTTGSSARSTGWFAPGDRPLRRRRRPGARPAAALVAAFVLLVAWRSCSGAGSPPRSSRPRTRATSPSRCSSPTPPRCSGPQAVIRRVEGFLREEPSVRERRGASPGSTC